MKKYNFAVLSLLTKMNITDIFSYGNIHTTLISWYIFAVYVFRENCLFPENKLQVYKMKIYYCKINLYKRLLRRLIEIYQFI